MPFWDLPCLRLWVCSVLWWLSCYCLHSKCILVYTYSLPRGIYPSCGEGEDYRVCWVFHGINKFLECCGSLWAFMWNLGWVFWGLEEIGQSCTLLRFCDLNMLCVNGIIPWFTPTLALSCLLCADIRWT